MPVLSKFNGIVIRLLCSRVLGARFHALYRGHELVVGIWPLEVIHGEVPGWVRAKVMSWAAEHHPELLAAWQACRSGRAPAPIAP